MGRVMNTVRPGSKFGRLTVRELIAKKPRRIWLCECTCGGVVKVQQNRLLTRNVQSCGCAVLDHGHAQVGRKSPTWTAWNNMLRRVRGTDAVTNRSYAERGITICKRWLKFENFLKDMGERPSPSLSLDRKNNNGNYCKRNCRWGTKEQQQNNRRVCVYVRANGKRLTISQWSRESKIPRSTIVKRLNSGVRPATAVTAPSGGL